MDPKPLIKQMLASVIRNLAAPVLVFLIAKGYITEDQAMQLVGIGASIGVAVVWGVVNKFDWNKKLTTALKLPKDSKYADIKKVWS